MEQTSDAVFEGKLTHEYSYPQRAAKNNELDLGIAKIDFYDSKNKIVHEIKQSDKMEDAHLLQVRYYLYLLEQNGIENPTGVLEYPKLRKRVTVESLTNENKQELEDVFLKARLIIEQKTCPATIKKSFCKKCAYYPLCYVEEE
jgi:CRISPR-associated exonuclease Cas4